MLTQFFFRPTNFFTQIFFRPIFFYPNLFLPKFFFCQNIFDPNFFSAKFFFDLIIFSANKFLPNFFFGQNIFWPNFFFRPKKNRPNFSWIWELRFGIQNLGFRIWGFGSVTQIFFRPRKIWPNFSWIWDLESGNFGIQNLGFRIWGFGSVTWNPIFGIQDLGLRIWDLTLLTNWVWPSSLRFFINSSEKKRVKFIWFSKPSLPSMKMFCHPSPRATCGLIYQFRAATLLYWIYCNNLWRETFQGQNTSKTSILWHAIKIIILLSFLMC